MMAVYLRLLAATMVTILSLPSAAPFYRPRSPSRSHATASSTGLHSGSSPALQLVTSPCKASCCCPCGQPREEERVVLNCNKTVTIYTEEAPAEDEPALWEELNTRLEIEQCHPNQLKKECKSMKFDAPFQDIASYVTNRCLNGISNADTLRDMARRYCTYHSGDEAVERAFECTTGCGLADQLNQVCRNLLGCPEPFDLVGKTCLFARIRLETEVVTFSFAKEVCEAMDGGRLPRIDSDEENAAVLATVQGTGGGAAHIGLNDIATEGTFVWAGSEDPLPSYFNWEDADGSEPASNDMNDNCATILVPSGEWINSRCFNTRNVIVCETSPVLVPSTP